jgi:hypothetical protein
MTGSKTILFFYGGVSAQDEQRDNHRENGYKYGDMMQSGMG